MSETLGYAVIDRESGSPMHWSANDKCLCISNVATVWPSRRSAIRAIDRSVTKWAADTGGPDSPLNYRIYRLASYSPPSGAAGSAPTTGRGW